MGSKRLTLLTLWGVFNYRMEDILKNGIEVAGRRFELLAFSTSQLKEQSVWAIAPLPALSADDVRRWMGDFENIRCVAKYAARMGQCFSSTLDTVDVKVMLFQCALLTLPDMIYREYNPSYGCTTGYVIPQTSAHEELHPKCAYLCRHMRCWTFLMSSAMSTSSPMGAASSLPSWLIW